MFENCSSLTSVTLGTEVREMGTLAFKGCTSLVSIDLSHTGVYRINNSTFSGCTSLKNVALPNPVTLIDNGAFYNCTALEHFFVPTSVIEIGSYAFEGCTSLKTVQLSGGLKVIGSSAFNSCISLTDINLPASLEKIEEHAFVGCRSLTALTFPASLYEIGRGVFDSCEKLLVYDEYGCAYIGNWLIDVHIKEGMSGDITLKEGTVGIAARAFASHNPQDIVTAITLPSGLKYISSEAFGNCRITTIEIPDSVIYLGENLFLGCENDVEIVIPEGVPSNPPSENEGI